MNLRRSIYWDTDFDKIDWDYNAPYVVDRVMQMGTAEKKNTNTNASSSARKPKAKNQLRKATNLSIEDIAAMKLDALSARGRKRDFYAIFFLLQEMSIQKLLELYDRKYHHSTVFHVIRSFTDFDDAEKDADPVVFDKSVTWPCIREAIKNEVRNCNIQDKFLPMANS